MKDALQRMQRFRWPVLGRGGLHICCLAILFSMPAAADEPEFGLAIEKLEHLFESDLSVFEVEATLGEENSFVGLKVESEFDSDAYDASESQLYYSRSIGSGLSGLVGARYLHSDEGDVSSAFLGLTAETVFGIEVLMLAFVGGAYTEGRFELERRTRLSPRMELLPKFELRAYSHDVESVAAELRLAHLTTDRLRTYVGVSWSRLVGSADDEDELTALAGLSYEW